MEGYVEVQIWMGVLQERKRRLLGFVSLLAFITLLKFRKYDISYLFNII